MRRTAVALFAFLLVPAALTLGAGPAAAQQRLGPYEVFFDCDTAVLTPQARAILDNVADAYRTLGAGQPITLNGHTDDTLNPVRAMAMSRVRANSVRNYLIRRGIPASVITVIGHGATRPQIVARGRREPANRRVEISIGRSTAW
jgi:OmpA-OmpF porin, OOP family